MLSHNVRERVTESPYYCKFTLSSGHGPLVFSGFSRGSQSADVRCNFMENPSMVSYIFPSNSNPQSADLNTEFEYFRWRARPNLRNSDQIERILTHRQNSYGKYQPTLWQKFAVGKPIISSISNDSFQNVSRVC